MKTGTAIQGTWEQSHSANDDTEASMGQGKEAVALVSASSSFALLSTHTVF